METENFDFDSMNFDDLTSLDSDKKSSSSTKDAEFDFDDNCVFDESADSANNFSDLPEKNYAYSIFLALCVIGSILMASTMSIIGLVVGASSILLALSGKKTKLLIISSVLSLLLIIALLDTDFLSSPNAPGVNRNETLNSIRTISAIILFLGIVFLNLWGLKDFYVCKIISLVLLILASVGLILTFVSYEQIFVGGMIFENRNNYNPLYYYNLINTSLLPISGFIAFLGALTLRLFAQEN